MNMAGTEGITSNPLFDTLADWESHLKHENAELTDLTDLLRATESNAGSPVPSPAKDQILPDKTNDRHYENSSSTKSKISSRSEPSGPRGPSR